MKGVKTKYGTSGKFKAKVGVHQESVRSSLLLVVVVEVLTSKVRDNLPWELLYADDLVLVAESREELKEKMLRQTK